MILKHCCSWTPHQVSVSKKNLKPLVYGKSHIYGISAKILLKLKLYLPLWRLSHSVIWYLCLAPSSYVTFLEVSFEIMPYFLHYFPVRYITAATTILSGLSYILSKNTVEFLRTTKRKWRDASSVFEYYAVEATRQIHPDQRNISGRTSYHCIDQNWNYADILNKIK